MRLLRCLHSKERDFNLSIALWEVSSLWFLISYGVSGTVRSSNSVKHFCSFWITSSSCATCCGTCSSVYTSMIFTNRSALLTLSLNSSFSVKICSFLCCSSAFSSSHFTWRVRFSFYIALLLSLRSFCTCTKPWVAHVVSSWARQR
jgi:hypothetical protein